MKLSLTPALGFSSTPKAEPVEEVRAPRPKGRKGTLIDAVRPVITDLSGIGDR